MPEITEALRRAAGEALQSNSAFQPTLRQHIESQLAVSRAETRRLEELIELLDRNPETQRIIELLGHRY